MATTVRLKGSTMLPLVQALMNLTQWLKPGKLSMRIGQIRLAIIPHAQELSDQFQALEKEYPIEEWEDRERGIPKIDPVIGKVKRKDVDAFIAAERELMEAVTPISIIRCLTPDDIDRVEEMARKLKPEDEANLPVVDFLAIAYIINETADIESSDIKEDERFVRAASDNGARPEVAAALE
jgi:hypothetical protein